MPGRRSVLAAMAMSFVAGCTPQQRAPSSPAAEEVVETDRVRALFDFMSNGTYTDPMFPTLVWDDVPALLARADRKRMLANFPINPLSSQSQATCSEGMVALWLVEGIRNGGQFASLNPLCFGDVTGRQEPWTLASERNHDRVLAAYRAWWAKVRGLSRDRAASIDPLEGTGLHWY